LGRPTNKTDKKLAHEVASRLGLIPNFIKSAADAPEVGHSYWQFAKSVYLDSPLPPLFKERLFVYLSRFCEVRYCIIRHFGFLIGKGHPAGDPEAPATVIADAIALLKRPVPWARDMEAVYARLAGLKAPLSAWPKPGSEVEDVIFACATLVFIDPHHNDRARRPAHRAGGTLLRAAHGLSGIRAYGPLLDADTSRDRDRCRYGAAPAGQRGTGPAPPRRP
jgi:hypothetical protein